MRVSEFPLFTLKEVPATAEVASHRYMLRAGMIHRTASGLYTWLPLGLRVLRKVEAVVREEMNAAGAVELLMPAVQPAELWQASGRWDDYGPELLRITDRHQRDFVFGPTHEEVITDIAAAVLKSYRQLPVNFYQIQTKFRDEIRPRFGVMRAREFVMKDAYSFHANAESLDETYTAMFDAYSRIFTRLGLDFRAVVADTGLIGGNASHEFQVLAAAGENAVVFSSSGDYAANIELCPCPPPSPRATPTTTMEKIATPGIKTIAELGAMLGLPPERNLKAIFVKSTDGGVVALFIRGDHQINAIKAAKHPLVASPFTFAEPEQIIAAVGCPPGSLGPVNLSVPCVVDETAAAMSDFACGANEEGFHYTGVNWGRDAPEPETADLRDICDGEEGPDDCGRVRIKRGIEVGHIFKLGTKYSEEMQAGILNENSERITVTMGCYGIGVSRIVAAAIEQNHDDNGIIWPLPMAPFEVVLCPMRYAGDDRHAGDNEVRTHTDRLYEALNNAGIDVLLDDRNTRAGAMFADADLLGIPLRVVIGKRGLEQNTIEYKWRNKQSSENLPVASCHETLIEQVRHARKTS